MAITSIELDAYKPKSNPYIIREKQHNKKDGTLGFKILPNGNKDAYFIYYIDGKEKLRKIGRYGKTKGLMSVGADWKLTTRTDWKLTRANYCKAYSTALE